MSPDSPHVVTAPGEPAAVEPGLRASATSNPGMVAALIGYLLGLVAARVNVFRAGVSSLSRGERWIWLLGLVVVLAFVRFEPALLIYVYEPELLATMVVFTSYYFAQMLRPGVRLFGWSSRLIRALRRAGG